MLAAVGGKCPGVIIVTCSKPVAAKPDRTTAGGLDPIPTALERSNWGDE